MLLGLRYIRLFPATSMAMWEELAGACRVGGRGNRHHLAGELGSNLCNSERRQHVSCPSEVIFVRKATIDRLFLNRPPGLVNGPRGSEVRNRTALGEVRT